MQNNPNNSFGLGPNAATLSYPARQMLLAQYADKMQTGELYNHPQWSDRGDRMRRSGMIDHPSMPSSGVRQGPTIDDLFFAKSYGQQVDPISSQVPPALKTIAPAKPAQAPTMKLSQTPTVKLAQATTVPPAQTVQAPARPQPPQAQPPPPINIHNQGGIDAIPNGNNIQDKRGIVVFVPGTLSNDGTFNQDFINGVDHVYRPRANYFFNWDASGVGHGQSSAALSDIEGTGSEKLAQEIQALKDKFPGAPVLVVAHSNGGNIAVSAENNYPGLTDVIMRLGSPDMGDEEHLDQNSRSSVLDIYDPKDDIDFTRASSFSGGHQGLAPVQKNWHRIQVTSPGAGLTAGIQKHLNMHSLPVWDQIQGDLVFLGKLKQFGGRADLQNLR